MNTNSNGTTVKGYKDGLYWYFLLISGETVYYDNVMSGGSLNFGAASAQLDAGKPVALFMSDYNLASTHNVGTGEDKLNNMVFINNHIMTAIGYYIINYYEETGGVETLFRTNYFLCVESGWDYRGMLYIGNNLTVDEAYGVGVAGFN